MPPHVGSTPSNSTTTIPSSAYQSVLLSIGGDSRISLQQQALVPIPEGQVLNDKLRNIGSVASGFASSVAADDQTSLSPSSIAGEYGRRSGGAIVSPILVDDDRCDEPHVLVQDPAPDGGYGWVIVFASFMCNLIVDGIAYTFGLFFEIFVLHFATSKSKVALCGALLNGCYLGVGPIVSSLANRYGCRFVTILGAIIACIALILSTAAPNIETLMVTYGVVGGIGFGMIYLPAIVSVGYYFTTKRAFATGVAVCGSGLGTFLFAPFCQYLLSVTTWQNTLFILGFLVLTCSLFGTLMRPLDIRAEAMLDDDDDDYGDNGDAQADDDDDDQLIDGDSRLALNGGAEFRKPLLQRIAEEKRRRLLAHSNSQFMLMMANGSIDVHDPAFKELRTRLIMNTEPGVHSTLYLDQLFVQSSGAPTAATTPSPTPCPSIYYPSASASIATLDTGRHQLSPIPEKKIISYENLSNDNSAETLNQLTVTTVVEVNEHRRLQDVFNRLDADELEEEEDNNANNNDDENDGDGGDLDGNPLSSSSSPSTIMSNNNNNNNNGASNGDDSSAAGSSGAAAPKSLSAEEQSLMSEHSSTFEDAQDHLDSDRLTIRSAATTDGSSPSRKETNENDNDDVDDEALAALYPSSVTLPQSPTYEQATSNGAIGNSAHQIRSNKSPNSPSSANHQRQQQQQQPMRPASASFHSNTPANFHPRSRRSATMRSHLNSTSDCGSNFLNPTTVAAAAASSSSTSRLSSNMAPVSPSAFNLGNSQIPVQVILSTPNHHKQQQQQQQQSNNNQSNQTNTSSGKDLSDATPSPTPTAGAFSFAGNKRSNNSQNQQHQSQQTIHVRPLSKKDIFYTGSTQLIPNSQLSLSHQCHSHVSVVDQSMVSIPARDIIQKVRRQIEAREQEMAANAAAASYAATNGANTTDGMQLRHRNICNKIVKFICPFNSVTDCFRKKKEWQKGGIKMMENDADDIEDGGDLKESIARHFSLSNSSQYNNRFAGSMVAADPPSPIEEEDSGEHHGDEDEEEEEEEEVEVEDEDEAPVDDLIDGEDAAEDDAAAAANIAYRRKLALQRRRRRKRKMLQANQRMNAPSNANDHILDDNRNKMEMISKSGRLERVFGDANNKCKPSLCARLRAKIPPSMSTILNEMLDMSLLRESSAFSILAISNIFGMMGFYVPFVYITQYATSSIKDGEDSYVTKESAAILISVIGITNTLGRLLFGFISDRLARNGKFAGIRMTALGLNNACILASGVTVVAIPFCTTYLMVLIDCVLFGLFVSAYICLTSIILVDMLGLDKLTNAFGLLCLFRGAASMIGPPVAGALFDLTQSYTITFAASGGLLMFSAILGFFIRVREHTVVQDDEDVECEA